MKVAAVILACGLICRAQAPKALLENTGKPMLVPFTCTEDDIQAFGLSCSTDEPCAVYLELVAVETLMPKLFLTGNFHTSSITLASILLASEDGGKTWTEPYQRVRAAGLEGIQFIDFEVGWISGQQLQTMPRDPFFLITSDGGKSWKQRPVYGESQVGSIERFFFDSRNTGQMVVDRMQSNEAGSRYVFYESQTGGESWMLREVSSKPLSLKRTRPPNADWRLRADSPSKSYRLEKRDGQRWQVIASFLVEVAACKVAERELAEPPPEPEVQPAKPTQPDTAPGGVLVVPRRKNQ